jgi:zinc protease
VIRHLLPLVVCVLPFLGDSAGTTRHRSNVGTPLPKLTSQQAPPLRSSLPNGLRVVVPPDHTVPLVAVAIVYGVGDVDDPPGRENLAHLLEHLMTRGSRHAKDGEFSALVAEAGGYGGGGNSRERTTRYTTVLPSNQLEMLLFLEADRMRGLQLTQTAVDSEKLTVKNEAEQGVNPPVDTPSQALAAIVRPSRNHADAVTLLELQAFYDRYYGPSNAAIAIVGDVQPLKAASLVRRYFGRIPAVAPIQRSTPAATRGRHVLVRPTLKAAQVFMAFPVPPTAVVDGEALRLLQAILSDPDGQGFRRRLEQGGVIAGTIGIAIRHLAEGTFMVVEATPAPNRTVEDVEAAVTSELSRHDLISEPDFERIKNRLLTRQAREWLFPDFRSELLAETELLQEDATRVFHRQHRIRAMTAADARRMLREHLGAAPSLVVITVPSK